MQRIPEPELMNEPEQVMAYSNADFEAAHQSVVENFTQIFPQLFSNPELPQTMLDLGCGSGDVTMRFARQFPNCTIDAVDGAEEMLKQAQVLFAKESLTERINLHHLAIANCDFENGSYNAIISNSLLHHLHDPQQLWLIIKQVATMDTAIYVCDLFRPETTKFASELVDQYANDEAEILRTDFYNSLLAAFTPDEVRTQIENAQLGSLNVDVVSDRHMLIYGYL